MPILDNNKRYKKPSIIKQDNVANFHFDFLVQIVEKFRQPTMIDMVLIEKAASIHSNIRTLERATIEYGALIETARGMSKNPAIADLKGARGDYLKYLQELNITPKVISSITRKVDEKEDKNKGFNY